jgi:hypothetical protein
MYKYLTIAFGSHQVTCSGGGWAISVLYDKKTENIRLFADPGGCLHRSSYQEGIKPQSGSDSLTRNNAPLLTKIACRPEGCPGGGPWTVREQKILPSIHYSS